MALLVCMGKALGRELKLTLTAEREGMIVPTEAGEQVLQRAARPAGQARKESSLCRSFHKTIPGP